MNALRALSAVALAALTCGAMAQTVRVPHFYVQMDQRPLRVPGHVLDTSLLTNLVFAARTQHGLAPDMTGDQLAKHWILGDAFPLVPNDQAILPRIARGELPPDKVCIMLPNFGTDAELTGNAIDTEFFVRSIPGRQGDEIDGLPDFPVGDSTARAYRHPFTRNAVYDPLHPNLDPPLRRYFRAFVEEYVYQMTQHSELPVPTAAQFDTEIDLCFYGNANTAFLLSQLADRPLYWSQTPVPGNEDAVTGEPRTLALLYEEQRQLQLAARAAGVIDQDEVWPPGNPNVQDYPNWAPGLSPSLTDADGDTADQNKSYNQWFSSICAKTKDRVMEVCTYSVLREHWPNIKVSNYHNFRTDGKLSRTGWMMGSLDRTLSTPARSAVNAFPRCQFFGVDGRWTLYPGSPVLDGTVGAVSRTPWTARASVASGDFDCPVMYTLSPPAFGDWFNDGFGIPGHLNKGLQQPNLHLPSPDNARLEHRGDATTRVGRFVAESILDSTGGHVDRLRPFIDMVGKGTDHGGDTATAQEIRQRLAMLRAKNIAGGTFFAGSFSGDPSHATYPDAVTAWNDTIDVINEVYATRVVKIKPRVGSVSTASADLAPSTLEFTLNVNGAPKAVEIGAALTSLPHTFTTDLEVRFSVPQAYTDSDFIINIEGSTITTDTSLEGSPDGFVLVGSADPAAWRYLPLAEDSGRVTEPSSYIHRLWTPLHSVGDDTVERTFRRSFYMRREQNYPAVSDGILRLRLVQIGSHPYRMRTKYDLVQAIPVPHCATCFPMGPPVIRNGLEPEFCVPIHHDDWDDDGPWPDGPQDNPILNSTFSAQQRSVVAKFAAPVRTDAAASAPDAEQPYAVWYYIDTITNIQWRNVTAAIHVDLKRGSDPGTSNEIILTSNNPTQVLPPGYYAVVFNTEARDTGNGQFQHPLYTDGTTPAPTIYPNLDDNIEFHFRLFPDCDGGGVIDAGHHMCPRLPGECPADLDDDGNFWNGGHPDVPTTVEINDLLFFIEAFEMGHISADLDDDADPVEGIPDGSSDINDLLFFLWHFEDGC